MISEDENEDGPALREIAELISDFRKEYVERLANSVAEEKDQVAKSGYDPARGRGRGPWWADGG